MIWGILKTLALGIMEYSVVPLTDQLAFSPTHNVSLQPVPTSLNCPRCIPLVHIFVIFSISVHGIITVTVTLFSLHTGPVPNSLT